MKRAALGLVVLLCVLPVVARADSQSTAPPGPAGILSAEAEGFAYRVEYDLPVPLGTGTVAHVNASVTRATGGEGAHGVAGAPTEFDPAVGGKYQDPLSRGHPERARPQAECYHPGKLTDVRFIFPTDTQKETAGLPPTSYAIARCGAGPEAELHVRNGPVGDPAVGQPDGPVTAGALSSDALAQPRRDVLAATVASRAQGLAVLGGALRIGSVTASGASSTAGRPGTGASSASISVSDIDAAGVRFSLASTVSDGKSSVTLTTGSTTVPVDSSAAQAVVASANAALKPSGCRLTPLSTPDRYPQGFLFARPDPEVAVKPDGSLAASSRGGLLVVCDVPKNPVADATEFNPERIQVLVGFVYTSTAAHPDVGGFGLGDLGAPLPGPLTFAVPAPPVAAAPSLTAPAATLSPAGSPPEPTATAPGPQRARLAAGSLSLGMDAGLRWLLAAVCLAVWAALTHLGLTRLLGSGTRPTGGAAP